MSALEPTPFSALPDPWADRAVLPAAIARCRAMTERVLAALAERLDEVHGVELGERYWRVAIGPWLVYHAQQLMDRDARARAAVRAGRELVALDEADFRTPRDTLDFHSLFLTTHWTLQLISLSLRRMGKPVKTARVPPPAAAPAGQLALHRRIYRAVRKNGYALARRLLSCEILSDDIYPFNRRHEVLARALDWRLMPLLEELPESLRPAARPDDARRKALGGLPSCEDEFERLLIASLPSCLPALFLEGWPAARAHARRLLPRGTRVFLHSTGIYYRELYKLMVAEGSLSGAKIVGVQHGGHYGFSQWLNAEWYERSISDEYMTWGWSEDSRTRPMPVPWLSGSSAGGGARSGVLFATTSGFHEPAELAPAPMASQWPAFFAQRARFLEALGPAGRAAVTLRMPPRDYEWGERADIAARFPDLKLDDGGRYFLAALEAAALIVTDHPGTTFLESFARDVPGVHFFDETQWESRPSAVAALEPLRRAGIVHANPESAARQVLAVHADPRAWWDSPDVKAVRAAFAERYARTDPAWASKWAAALGHHLPRRSQLARN